MNPTDKFLEMSEAASSFFEDCEFEKGDMYGGRTHTCNNENFWKNAFPDRKNWKSIMLARAGELVYGVTNDNGNPNYVVNCGHNEYETVFRLFRPCELLDMLNGHSGGYFTEYETWNVKDPVETMKRIVEYTSGKDKDRKYFGQFKSIEEFMLAFYMLEVHWFIWFDNGKTWG